MIKMNVLDKKTEISPENRRSNAITSHFFAPEKYKIPRLPLLDDMVAAVKKSGTLPDLSRTVFIGVQHMLETTVTLFDALIALGVSPSNMYFSGKCYSSAPEIEAAVRERGIHLMRSNAPEEPGRYQRYCQKSIIKMWSYCLKDIEQKTVDRLIILDDGARCLESMPGSAALSYPIAAIEQTRGGLYSQVIKKLPFPLIEVATCAAKKHLESHLIAIAAVYGIKKALNKLELNQNITFGVVGNGVIGNAICHYLISLGHYVYVFDQDKMAFEGIRSHHVFRMEGISEVFTMADVIIGCTGQDITVGIDVPSLTKKHKIFISCSSEDKEFFSLLNFIAYQDPRYFAPLSDISYQTPDGSKILILQYGFPVNFDRTPSNVPANKIEITQGLLLGGCLQAIHCAKKLVDDGITMNCGSRQILNPIIQRYVASHWLPRQAKEDYPSEYLTLFNDLNWMEKNSGGKYYPDATLEACFDANMVADNISPPRLSYAKL